MPKNINLSGGWNVEVSQKIKKKRLVYSVNGEIAHIGDQVIGNLNYDLKKINYDFASIPKNKRRFIISFSGAVHKDQFHIQYENKDNKINQFGSAFMTIKSNSLMEGIFLGFGPESKGPIIGKIRFIKA